MSFVSNDTCNSPETIGAILLVRIVIKKKKKKKKQGPHLLPNEGKTPILRHSTVQT